MATPCDKELDEAIEAIENFFKQNQRGVDTARKPSNQCTDGQRYLSVPSGNDNNIQTFSFSFSDIDGSIECIPHIQVQQLQNMGHIEHTMRTHANDNVYEKTREPKREITPFQADIGRISNIPGSNSLLSKHDSLHSSYNYRCANNSTRNHTNNIYHNNVSSNSIAYNYSTTSLMNPALNVTHQQQHNGNLLSSQSTATAIRNYNNQLSIAPKLPKTNGFVQQQQQHNNQYYSNGSTPNYDLSTAVQQPGNDHQQQQHNNHYYSNGSTPNYYLSTAVQQPGNNQQQQQLQPQQNSNGRSSLKGSSGTPNIMKQSIRQRMIHLLALNSLNKSEIILKLQQEGMHKGEQIAITQILANVASMRANVYHLNRYLWKDVQEDWPFYTEQERQIVKRRNPLNVTPPGSEGGSSTSGPSLSNAHNSSSPQSDSKRPLIDSDDDLGSMPTSKKARISYNEKDILQDSNQSSVTQNASLPVFHVAVEWIHSPSSDEYRSAQDLVDDVISERGNTNLIEPLQDDLSEYRQVCEFVQRIKIRFAQLGELSYARHKKRQYEELQRQILKEYNESIRNNKIAQRYEHGHNELFHISQLIQDFDVASTDGHCQPQENK